MNRPPRYATLRDHLRVLKEQAWLIAVTAFVAAVVALLVGIAQSPSYDATATVSYQGAPAQRDIYRALRDPRVAEDVQRSLASSVPPAQLQNAVTLTSTPNLLLVNVTATSGDADFARRLADAYGRQIVGNVNRDVRARLELESDDLIERAEALPDGSGPQEAALRAQADRLRDASRDASPTRFFRPADEPRTEGAGRLLGNAALGLALGLIVGIGVAFLRRAVDRRLHGAREIQAQLELPVLGHVSRGSLRGASEPQDDGVATHDLEPYRLLRKNLEVLREPSPRTILVAGPRAEAGTSTVAASLARVHALANRPVLLVECDLREPGLAERLGLEARPGLADVLEDGVRPASVVQELDLIAAPSRQGGAEERGTEAEPGATRLACITAGDPPSRPAELAGSEELRDLLREVSQPFAVTILDCGPLLGAVDTVELLPLADAVVLCIRSGSTTREDALAAKATLARFAEAPAGIVVTDLRGEDELPLEPES